MSARRSINRQVEVAELVGQVEREADQLRWEVARLLDFLRELQRSSALAPVSEWRQGVYTNLIDCFEKTTGTYADLAQKIIACAATHCPDLPVRYYYGEVLQNIVEHVRLLAQLGVSLARTLPASGPISDLGAIQAIIWSISRRIPCPPVLVPVISSQFMYVHLNYVQGVGIIGVPPYALSRPYLDLPILWHEVAGYSVARQKVSGDALEEQAKDLQRRLRDVLPGTRSLWDSYRKLYELSVSQNPRVKLNITHASNTASIGLAKHNEIREYFAHDNYDPKILTVDTDYDWQMRWLGQILEDRFGLQELDGTMLVSLEVALSRAYESPDVGDKGHPPPALRLQIAREYLHLRGVTVSTSGTTTDEIGKMAKVIAAHVFEQYSEQGGSNSGADVAKAVKEAVIGFVAKALRSSQPYKLEELTTNDAILQARDALERSSTSDVVLSNRIWDQARFTVSGTPPTMVDEPCDEKADAQRLLEKLRSIRFTETDENTGGGYRPDSAIASHFG